MKLLYNILRLLRPRHWIKNFLIFASILFSGHLFDFKVFMITSLGFIVFCLLSSSIYIINDIFDIKKDRLHPFKRFRPLAHNDIPISLAIAISLTLGFFGLSIGILINPAFFLAITIYLILTISYSAVLKHITIIDILALASGYILRVLAGELATQYHISVWLLLTIISVSLFLAVGKRRSELTLLSSSPSEKIAATRKTLSHYNEQLLDVYATIFAASTFISYSLFTFFENSIGFKPSLGILLPNYLPSFLDRKWLMVTILPVVYGLMRYLQNIYEKHEGESPERVIFSDRALLISVGIWLFLVIIIIYFLNPYS